MTPQNQRSRDHANEVRPAENIGKRNPGRWNQKWKKIRSGPEDRNRTRNVKNKREKEIKNQGKGGGRGRGREREEGK